MSPSVFSEGVESLLLCQPGISPGEDMSCLVDPGQSTPMLCSCWEGWRGVGRRGQGWTVRAGIVPWGLSDPSVFRKSRKTHERGRICPHVFTAPVLRSGWHILEFYFIFS